MEMFGTIKKQWKIFIVSFVALFASFAFNVFGVQSTAWFNSFQKDSGALVVHKLACNIESGKDEFGGMLVTGIDSYKFSFDDKNPVCQKDNSKVYVSQFGLQGHVTLNAYKVMNGIGIGLRPFLIMTQIFWAAFSALVLSAFIVWVAAKFGRFTASISMLLLCVSVWPVGFARNMYWALPLFFLPIILTLFYYQKPTRTMSYWLFLAGLFILFLLKFLNGFEFISEVILAPVAVSAYYILLRAEGYRQVFKEAANIVAAGVLAFVLALSLTYLQVYHYTGDGDQAMHMIKERIIERTGTGDAFESYVYAGLGHTLPDVYQTLNGYADLQELPYSRLSPVVTPTVSLINYALLPAINIPIPIKEPLYTILNSFAAIAALSFWLVHRLRRSAKGLLKKEYFALQQAMWIGLIASLSWLVVGHSHSYVHAHITGIIYYLPFLLFAYIAIGKGVENIYSKMMKLFETRVKK